MPTPVTREQLRELRASKVAAQEVFSRASAAIKNAPPGTDMVELDIIEQRAVRLSVEADAAYETALRTFDKQQTQQMVLAGAQPQADAALLKDLGDALPLDPAPIAPEKCPHCGGDDVEEMEGREADHDANIAYHPGGRWCNTCGRWVHENEEPERFDETTGGFGRA